MVATGQSPYGDHLLQIGSRNVPLVTTLSIKSGCDLQGTEYSKANLQDCK